jgi:hypothetical protein
MTPGQEHPLAEQIKLGTSIHLSFNQLQAVNRAFHWPLTPRQGQPCLNRGGIGPKAARESLEGRAPTLLRLRQLGANASRFPLPNHAIERLHQGDSRIALRMLTTHLLHQRSKPGRLVCRRAH